MSYWNFFCVLFFSYKYVCCNHFHLQARMFFFLIFYFYYFINLMLHAHSYFMLLKAIASHVMCFFFKFYCVSYFTCYKNSNCNFVIINFFYWFAEMRACPENASLFDLFYAISMKRGSSRRKINICKKYNMRI